MKQTSRYALMTCVLCALSASACRADLLFHVSLNTLPLVGQPSPPSPFSLEFELTDGGSVMNTALISNFDFGGGLAAGTPNFNPATAGSGSLSSSVTLHDGTGFLANTFTQEFAPGNTLDFDVQLTTNVDAPAPDAFSFAILDRDGNRLPTQDTFGTDFFFTVELNASNLSVQDVQTFASHPSSPIQLNAPSVQAIPEPTAVTLLVIGLAGIIVALRRK